jgi:hypothetical protein
MATCTLQPTAGTCNPCIGPTQSARRVAIIESAVSNPGQNMDAKWQALATAANFSSMILPQTALDDSANLLANYDILIVSSPFVVLPANRRATLLSFVNAGRGLFIQGEYVSSMFEGNQVWELVVDSLGANFSWGIAISASFPSSAVGCWSTTPALVGNLQQNYGHPGSATGAGFGAIQVTSGMPIGFRYCRQGGGLVVSNTDKDGFNQDNADWIAHYRDILYRLSHPNLCPN